jgi:hypothetical protein
MVGWTERWNILYMVGGQDDATYMVGGKIVDGQNGAYGTYTVF